MNRNTIKFIAAFTMVLDHVAVILLQPYTVTWFILRSIGRIAFVLFAYMIAEGFFKTRNLKMYFLRLFAFAAVIELFIIGYYFVTDINYILTTNVIWPLVFGLGGLMLLKHHSIWVRLLVVPLVFLAEFSGIPYGAYGTLMILIFGLYPNKLTQFIFVVGLNLVFIEVPFLQAAGLGQYARYQGSMWFQWFSLVAFIFVFLYNHQKGKWNTKWFFYIFYPLHLGLIYLIDFLLK